MARPARFFMTEREREHVQMCMVGNVHSLQYLPDLWEHCIEYFLFFDIQKTGMFTGRTTLSTKIHYSTDCKTYNVVKAKTNTTMFLLCLLFIIRIGTDVKPDC